MHNALANPRGLPNNAGKGYCYAGNEGGQFPPPDYDDDDAGAVKDYTSPPVSGLDHRKLTNEFTRSGMLRPVDDPHLARHVTSPHHHHYLPSSRSLHY
ncbi:hypothetical protein ACOMHN_020052 [Nucella lapillus]